MNGWPAQKPHPLIRPRETIASRREDCQHDSAFPETRVCPCEPFAEAVRRTAASLWCKTFELHAGEPQLARSSCCRRAVEAAYTYLARWVDHLVTVLGMYGMYPVQQEL